MKQFQRFLTHCHPAGLGVYSDNSSTMCIFLINSVHFLLIITCKYTAVNSHF